MRHIKLYTPLFLSFTTLFFAACNSDTAPSEKETSSVLQTHEGRIVYDDNGLNMQGYYAYDANKEGRRPAVIIVPEWWGVNEYVKKRARQLAALGYIAFVADYYGNGKIADTPDSAMANAMPFYQDPQLGKARFNAAYEKVKSFAATDTTQIAAIGYCFGGTQVLNAAKLGQQLRGVVSFHGGLAGVPANKELLKAAILVCHGAADSMVPAEEVANFKKELDGIGANYIFKSYEGATHAFSNPDATEKGKKFNLDIAYNAAADTASWAEMKSFFQQIFK